jgi:transcription antitermination factor NusA-like protein
LPLKIPICAFDAKTGILCAKCESKLKSGEITRADVSASKAMVQLAERSSEVSKASLVRALEVNGNYILEVEGQDVQPLRSNHEITSKLEQILGGRVWIVGAQSSERKFLEDLFYPIRILTVNTVWLPDGSRMTKVIVPGGRGEDYERELEMLKDAVLVVRKTGVLVETETEAIPRA